MNDDFVRRSDILELKRTLYRVRYGTGCQSIEDTEAVEVNDIESIPTADVQPVKSGKWITRNSVYLQSGEIIATCSLCNNKLRILGNLSDFNFCPNCGADMRGADR